jgi:PPOX class probable F420-dependent enzyme
MTGTSAEAVETKLKEARVARLATVDEKAVPHLIPICYVFDGIAFYTAVDAKPKRVEGKQLARVKNIQANPQVALLIDEYDEDWNQLWYILVRGTAEVLDSDKEKQRAMQLLTDKYSNYRLGWLPEDSLVIRIQPRHTTSWGKL